MTLGGFAITPHKVSICVLLQPVRFSTSSDLPHIRLSAQPTRPVLDGHHEGQITSHPVQILLPSFYQKLSSDTSCLIPFKLSTQSHASYLEPSLSQLVFQLREVCGHIGNWLAEHLVARLSSLSSPNDLFNFFAEIGGIIGSAGSSAVEDSRVYLDVNSKLGIFLRHCLLAFNMLSFEGVCHLLTSIGIYHEEEGMLDSMRYESHDSTNNLVASKCKTYHREATAGINAKQHAKTFSRPVEAQVRHEDTEDMVRSKYGGKDKEISSCMSMTPLREKFLQTKLQVQGYLMEQAIAIENSRNVFYPSALEPNMKQIKRLSTETHYVQGYPMEQANATENSGEDDLFPGALEPILKQIENLSPETHYVDFVRYLDSLSHNDYFSALDNLHCHFDYSAGSEVFDFGGPGSSAHIVPERYQIALLCMGLMHFHLGHPKKALEVLSEAVHVSQERIDDSCLAYALAAICNLLSQISSSNASGILGTSYPAFSSSSTLLCVKQQQFILLQETLRRAESSNLKELVASVHLAMAKFELENVQRPLPLFGPKASAKLRTSPINVYQELSLCSHLISDFSKEGRNNTCPHAVSTALLENLRKSRYSSSILSGKNEPQKSTSALGFFADSRSIPRSVLQLVGSSYLFRASAWEMHGSTSLARANSLVFATCYSNSACSSDHALAHAKLLHQLALFNGCKVAFSALEVAEKKFSSTSSSAILLVKLRLLHEHALHEGNVKLAQRVCDELENLASSAAGVDMEIKIEAGIRHAQTLLASKELSQASTIANSLSCMCYNYNMSLENARVLLLHAEIHKKSGNPVLGIPYVLASISYCQAYNMDLLKASATLTLAELLLSLGSNHAGRALMLIHGCLPLILGHGGLELCVRAHVAEAKCYLSDLNYSACDDPEAVLGPLRQASEDVEILGYHELAVEVFYLMAIICNKLKMIKERDAAASSFKKHLLALENHNPLGES